LKQPFKNFDQENKKF